ncbi:MAG: ABC transporter permease [Candidatus Bathyarchaeia archaeon]
MSRRETLSIGLNDQFKRALAICVKDIRIYYFKGPVIIFGLLLPLFLFAAFLIGRGLPSQFLVSRLTAITIFSTATAVAPMIMPWETRARTLERLISSPISIATIILGDVLASFMFGAFFSLVPVIISLIMNVKLIHPLLFLVSVLMASFCFSSLAAILSTPPADVPANVMMLSGLVKFPLIFISGIFIPLEGMPEWGRLIASLSPLTYFTEIAAYSIEGVSFYPIELDILILLGFCIAFIVAAIKLHERSMAKRL